MTTAPRTNNRMHHALLLVIDDKNPGLLVGGSRFGFGHSVGGYWGLGLFLECGLRIAYRILVSFIGIAYLRGSQGHDG